MNKSYATIKDFGPTDENQILRKMAHTNSSPGSVEKNMAYGSNADAVKSMNSYTGSKYIAEYCANTGSDDSSCKVAINNNSSFLPNMLGNCSNNEKKYGNQVLRNILAEMFQVVVKGDFKQISSDPLTVGAPILSVPVADKYGDLEVIYEASPEQITEIVSGNNYYWNEATNRGVAKEIRAEVLSRAGITYKEKIIREYN